MLSTIEYKIIELESFLASDKIFANPVTITGSIGVYGLLVTIEDALNNLGIYSDGTNQYSGGGTGDIKTPSINVDRTKSFAIELDFRMEVLGYGNNSIGRPVIVAGTSYRWLGIEVNNAGYPGILYNNNNHSFATDVQLETNKWYKGKIEYDFGVINLYIDNNLVKSVGTPSNTVTFTAEGQGSTLDEVLTLSLIHN
mgnify:CR=1 FL=1